METFSYSVMAKPSGTIDQKIMTSEFGDGYEQAIGVGINNQRVRWDVQFTGATDGRKPDARPVIEFLDRHKGFKSFLWTAPNGQQGYYRATGYQLNYQSRTVVQVSWTMQQVFYL